MEPYTIMLNQVATPRQQFLLLFSFVDDTFCRRQAYEICKMIYMVDLKIK